MTKLSPFRLTLIAVGCVLSGAFFIASAAPANEPLATGDSTVIRDNVNIAVHIPADLAEPHGPAGILVYIGGTSDSIDSYQKKLSALADELDLVLVVPQMPWFKDPSKVPLPGIYRAIDHLVDEIQKQFNTDPRWMIFGGASAGGAPALELSQKWSSKTALLLLSSTGPFPNLGRVPTLHVVAEKEIARLGSRPELGRGRIDSFGVPGGVHSPQFPHLTVWLETQVSVLRLEQASQTMRLVEEQLFKKDTTQAAAILKSTMDAIQILRTPVNGDAGDAFFQYENKHRQELLAKYALVIQSLEKLNAKISPQETPTQAPSPESSTATPVASVSPAAP